LKNYEYYGVLLLELSNQVRWMDGACSAHKRDVRSLYLLVAYISVYVAKAAIHLPFLLGHPLKGGALAGLGRERRL
jgi:hypothetical protein